MNLIERVEKLMSVVRDEDKGELKTLKSEVERVLLLDNIKDHDAIKFLVKKYSEQIVEIDDILKTANSKMLNDKDRDTIIYKKEFMSDFLSMFVDLDKLKESLDKEIKSQEDFVDSQLEDK